MAQITINEVSQNYTYNIGTSSFCCVALPITAQWGPGYFGCGSKTGEDKEDILENVAWQRFPATQAGLESFVSTYRGPAANYRLAKDYSYQMAMTLLTSGYDVLVCRLSPGTRAEGRIAVKKGDAADTDNYLTIKAKYPGTFGNNLIATLKKVPNNNCWNIVCYILDSGIKTAVENITFTFDVEHSTDSILHIDEVQSNFFDFVITGEITDESEMFTDNVQLGKDEDTNCGADGTDRGADAEADAAIDAAIQSAKDRFAAVYPTSDDKDRSAEYTKALSDVKGKIDSTRANTLAYREWIFTNALDAYELLKDKLTYNPNRIIASWDDQDIEEITGEKVTKLAELSPFHVKLMDVAYYSRCATALLDIPRSLTRSGVYNEEEDTTKEGYAQKLARYIPANANLDVNAGLYQTHSALFAPWGQYKYVGTSKQNPASPSFQALLIQRAMVLNQSLQYEWIMPTNRTHKLSLGKLDYNVPKKYMDIWQTLEGVGVNIITSIPDMGTVLWGNSTLFEVPPATYQALANLSTRYLFNAVKDVVYRVGTKITFSYNNSEAQSSFYTGVSPILDTMKNAGAIIDYYIKVSDDLDLDGQVKANSIIGKIYLAINGVVNDITVDMIALPANTDLTQYQ